MLNKDFVRERFDKLTQENVINFLITFIKCEYIYKTIYKLTCDKTSSKEIRLHLTTIKNSLKKLGYYDEDTINIIFGTSRHSYRYLRNAVVHKISRKAIHFIELNHNQQIEKMNSFIEQLKRLF